MNSKYPWQMQLFEQFRIFGVRKYMKLSFFVGKVSIFDIGNISYPIIDNPLRQCILKPWCFAAVTRSFSQTISNQWRKNTLSKQLGKIPQTFGVQFDTYRSQILSLTLQYTKFTLRKNCYEIWKIRSQLILWITRRVI